MNRNKLIGMILVAIGLGLVAYALFLASDPEEKEVDSE